ncbi:MAG TPA: hypothetical protein VMT67_08020 [Terriglobales bacterium]|nr:hypothetical protein [Terriglobales bacterium]
MFRSGGGFINGDTRYDFIEDIESASTAVPDPLLWLDADHMKTPALSVKNLEKQRNASRVSNADCVAQAPSALRITPPSS